MSKWRERKLRVRGNGEIMSKWRESGNGEGMRTWRENEEIKRK